MNHTEMVALIRAGAPNPGETWADLGAGTGNFTRALGELLGPAGAIYAVDRDAGAVACLRDLAQRTGSGAAIHPLQADFTRPLDLPPLDGVLLANALHFVRDQVNLLKLVRGYLRPGGRVLLVEYEVSRARGWIRFPVPFARYAELAAAAGLAAPERVGTRRSPSTGVVLYAATAARE